jgi:hypothetical protein
LLDAPASLSAPTLREPRRELTALTALTSLTSVEPTAELSPSPTKTRLPWLETGDGVARRFPAFGVTLHHMAYVYERPRRSARPIGYLRRGARFRASEEVSRQGCCARLVRDRWRRLRVCRRGRQRRQRAPGPCRSAAAAGAVGRPALPLRRRRGRADVPQFLRLPSPEEERAVQSAFHDLG